MQVRELEPGQRQLFVDELHVEAKRNVFTQFHQAQKKGAVIRPYGYGNMTGSCQTRSMPQWDPVKQLYVLPVLGGDPEADKHNLNGQSKAQWFESKDGVQWSFGGISQLEYGYEPPCKLNDAGVWFGRAHGSSLLSVVVLRPMRHHR